MISVHDVRADGRAASIAVTATTAVAEGAVAGSTLRIAALADVLQTLRALAGWQLTAADAAHLRLDVVPVVQPTACFAA